MVKWIHVDNARAYSKVVVENYADGVVAAADQPYSKTEKTIRIDEDKVLLGVRIWLGFPNTGAASATFEGGIRIADRPIFTREDFRDNPDAIVIAWKEVHVHRYVEAGGGHGEAVMDTETEYWFDSPIKPLLEEDDLIYINRHIDGGTHDWGGYIVELYLGEKP